MSILECKKCKKVIAIPNHIEDKENYICEKCKKKLEEKQSD